MYSVCTGERSYSQLVVCQDQPVSDSTAVAVTLEAVTLEAVTFEAVFLQETTYCTPLLVAAIGVCAGSKEHHTHGRQYPSVTTPCYCPSEMGKVILNVQRLHRSNKLFTAGRLLRSHAFTCVRLHSCGSHLRSSHLRSSHLRGSLPTGGQ